VSFKNQPVSQEWLIKLNKELLSWDVKTYFHEDVVVNQQKLGIIFSDRYNKYTVNTSVFSFSPLEENWKEVDLLKIKQLKITSDATWPEITLRQEYPRGRDLFVQLQNLPAVSCARMINFCFLNPMISYEQNKKFRFFKKGQIEEKHLKLIIRKEQSESSN
jgi:hypothetical protein